MSKRHEHWCPVVQTSGLIDVDCTCGAERPGPSYDALRAALARLVAAATVLVGDVRTTVLKDWPSLHQNAEAVHAAIAAAEEAMRE